MPLGIAVLCPNYCIIFYRWRWNAYFYKPSY